MYRRYVLNLAARSHWKLCLRMLDSCDPPQITTSSSSNISLHRIFASSRMRYASRSGSKAAPGKGPPMAGGGSGRDIEDYDDDDDDDDDDSDDDLEEVEDPPGYEWDYETWNLLHQGRKEGQLSRKWPLPMYKGREMVDYHMIKNRLDGLKVITDPKMEYDLRRQLHEGTVNLFKRMQDATRELDAMQEKRKLEESTKNKEVLQITEGETKEKDSEVQVNGEVLQIVEGETKEKDSEVQVNGEVASDVKDVIDASSQVVDAAISKLEIAAESEQSEIDEVTLLDTSKEASQKEGVGVDSRESKDLAPSTLYPIEQGLQQEGDGEGTDLSAVVTAVDDVIKDVLSVPEVMTLELGKDMLVEAEQAVEDDGINVFDYDKWVAYREQQVAKRYAEEDERKHATLRWKIQMVLGPGDVVHPANRKASVSVYVRELCLSKYAKQRLLALVGRRYNPPKDELTIVSERYPHRYENQKDVLRLLLALIEEAKKADQLVYDARIRYLKSKRAELTDVNLSVAAM